MLQNLIYEWHRRQRIKNPEKRDHCSWLLIGIMGPEWWIEHGFVREHPEGRCYIDMAQPRMKLAIEGDGERFHTDVLRDERRDDFLRSRGWYVMRFPYNDLVHQSGKVREKILRTYRSFADPTPEEIKATQRMMKRSGFKL